MHKESPLKESIQIFNVEDAMLNEKNLDLMFKSEILQNVHSLMLSKNSLGNKGIEILFMKSHNRLRHIKCLDISSNNIVGEDGAKIIANSDAFP